MPDPLISLIVATGLVGFGLALFWPRRGLLHQWRRVRQWNTRITMEDALKHIHKCEMSSQTPTVESLAGALNVTVNQAAALLARMQRHQLVDLGPEGFHLTPTGRDHALRVIRAHRLWERFLADETGYAQEEWHDQAERWEHRLTADQAEVLFARLGRPTHDPHGDPIPTADGQFVPHGGKPLSALDLDTPARIVHLEDEPETIYAQLVAEGLHPGMEVRLTGRSQERLRFWAEGDEHLLAPIVAANISVVPLPQPLEAAPQPGLRLSALKPGEKARVVALTPGLRGQERRRLMDLGILPGTVIEAEFANPSGDPVAYLIRGATIALRREQAEKIMIAPPDDGGNEDGNPRDIPHDPLDRHSSRKETSP